MARHEDEAEEVIPDVLIDRRVRVDALLSPLDVAPHLFAFALERLAAADRVDRAMLRRRHQPGARFLRHARGGPLLERGNESVLRELLGRTDVADETSQPGDEPGRLDPPDRFDRAMRFDDRRLAATWALERVFLRRIYGQSSLTCPRSRRSAGSRRCRRRTARAWAIRGRRPSSAPARAS